MTATNQKHIRLKNTVFILAFPGAVWLLMELLVHGIVGGHLFASSADWIALFRSLITTFCFALGLNCNMALGRMDTSAGAQMYLGCIVGGNFALWIAEQLGGMFASSLIILCSVTVGMLAGALVGFVFIKLRILPMVLGLGLSLVLECISFSVNNNQGLSLYGVSGNLSKIWYIAIVASIVVLIMLYLFQFSAFGYSRRAIQGNQKLAFDAGINIYSNAFWCYMIAGGLVTLAGVFRTAYQTNLVPVLGMSSNASVFSNMFPMAIGMWLARKSNPVVGILLGSLAVECLTKGLAKFSLVGMSTDLQTCIKYSCWLVFMIYNNNSYRISDAARRKARIALAQKTRKEMGYGA